MSHQKLNDIEVPIEQLVEESGSIAVINIHPEKKTIYIVGEINECVANETVSALLSTDWEKVKEFELYITSQGGYLTHCFAIIDLILYIKNKFGVKVTTYGLGEIASAGFFIFICGDERKIFPSCRIFVHTHITMGDERTYDQRLKADKTEEKEIYDNYSKYTADQLNIPVKKAKALLKKSKWLNRKEAKDYNIGIELSSKEDQNGQAN